jgi:hypothetical protein
MNATGGARGRELGCGRAIAVARRPPVPAGEEQGRGLQA